MNILVGYVQSNGDLGRQALEVRALMALGCQTVRVEAADAPDKVFKPVLDSVCGFLGPGDQLLVPDITHLGSSPSSAEAFLSRLKARGASLRLLDAHELDAELRPSRPRAPLREGRGVDPRTVRALSAHGFGPTQIARRLGVSRMTVWRKLSGLQASGLR